VLQRGISSVSKLSFILAIDSSLSLRLRADSSDVSSRNYSCSQLRERECTEIAIKRNPHPAYFVHVYVYTHNLQRSQLQVYIHVSSYLSQYAKAQAAFAYSRRTRESPSSMERFNRQSRADKRIKPAKSILIETLA